MTAWRPAMGPVLLMLALPLAAPAVTVCQAGSVEMIVGGAAAAPCGFSLPAANAVAPAGTAVALRSGPSQRERVAPQTQRERDGERRRILESEWQREHHTLAELQRQGAMADGAQLARTRANLAALQGELSRLGP
jgi:hypothetical protein